MLSWTITLLHDRQQKWPRLLIPQPGGHAGGNLPPEGSQGKKWRIQGEQCRGKKQKERERGVKKEKRKKRERGKKKVRGQGKKKRKGKKGWKSKESRWRKEGIFGYK